MEPVDDGFQLSTDAVKVYGGCQHQHIRIPELGVDFLHGILLDAGMPLPLHAGITSQAGVYRIICNGEDFHLVVQAGTSGKCLRQQVRIPTPSHTAGKNYDPAHSISSEASPQSRIMARAVNSAIFRKLSTRMDSSPPCI